MKLTVVIILIIGCTYPVLADELDSEMKNFESLSVEDREIAKKLKFSDPVISPLSTRHFTFIKGMINVKNRSSKALVSDKLEIETRMLFENNDDKWSVIKCTGDIVIPEKGRQTLNLSFREYNTYFRKFFGDEKIQSDNTYTMVRYLGIIVFEDVKTDKSSHPTQWWKDDTLVINK